MIVKEQIASYPVVSSKIVIYPNETLEFQFGIAVPSNIPVSLRNTRYYFKTSLAIDDAKDSIDRDFVSIRPAGNLKTFIEAWEQLGFAIQNEEYTGTDDLSLQVLTFTPTTPREDGFQKLAFQLHPDRYRTRLCGTYIVNRKRSRFDFLTHELASPEKAVQTLRSFLQSL